MKEKIKVQVVLYRERHAELWREMNKIRPANRAERLRSLALIGLLRLQQLAAQAQQEENDQGKESDCI